MPIIVQVHRMVIMAQSLPSLTGTLLPFLTGRQMFLSRRLGDAGLFVKFSNGRLCLGLLFGLDVFGHS